MADQHNDAGGRTPGERAADEAALGPKVADKQATTPERFDEEAGEARYRTSVASRQAMQQARATADVLVPLEARLAAHEDEGRRIRAELAALRGAVAPDEDVAAGVMAEFPRYHNRWTNVQAAEAELSGLAGVGLQPGVTLTHAVPRTPGELGPPAEPRAAHPEGYPGNPLQPAPAGGPSMLGVSAEPESGRPMSVLAGADNPQPPSSGRDQSRSTAQVQAEQAAAAGPDDSDTTPQSAKSAGDVPRAHDPFAKSVGDKLSSKAPDKPTEKK